jgi:peptidoglycan hydrolase-like protein with peptidoglycan-binding domain
VDDPAPGDIVIFWRERPDSWKGHVGIFFGFSKNRSLVFSLGGNQKNTVSIQGYNASTVLGFRRLTSEIMTGVPNAKPVLKLGSNGEEVSKLQSVLGELGFDCGAADGIFGKRTESQLMAFQREEGQEPDGIYGPGTKTLIESIFQT